MTSCVAVLLHGAEESDLLVRVGQATGITSVRLRMRRSREHESRTTATVLNDIDAVVAGAKLTNQGSRVYLLGAGLDAGICGYYAALYPRELAGLVLVDPDFRAEEGPPWGSLVDDFGYLKPGRAVEAVRTPTLIVRTAPRELPTMIFAAQLVDTRDAATIVDWIRM